MNCHHPGKITMHKLTFLFYVPFLRFEHFPVRIYFPRSVRVCQINEIAPLCLIPLQVCCKYPFHPTMWKIIHTIYTSQTLTPKLTHFSICTVSSWLVLLCPKYSEWFAEYFWASNTQVLNHKTLTCVVLHFFCGICAYVNELCSCR